MGDQIAFIIPIRGTNMGKEITFIIPNRGGQHINFVIGKLREFYPDAKFIVITQADDKPFMRGQLWNIAYNYVDTKYMCFIDNDMFFPKYIDLIGIYEKLKCITLQPFINIQQVKITNEDKLEYEVTSDAVKNGGAKGGVSFMSKEAFEKINGMSNLYLGWGREDNEFDCRGKIIDINEKICHITHPRRCGNTKNLDLNIKYFRERGKRNWMIDGYKNTTCKVVKKEMVQQNVQFIDVKDIYVNEEFEYKSLLDEHHKKID